MKKDASNRTLYLDDETWGRLSALAELQGVARSQVLRDLITESSIVHERALERLSQLKADFKSGKLK